MITFEFWLDHQFPTPVLIAMGCTADQVTKYDKFRQNYVDSVLPQYRGLPAKEEIIGAYYVKYPDERPVTTLTVAELKQILAK